MKPIVATQRGHHILQQCHISHISDITISFSVPQPWDDIKSIQLLTDATSWSKTQHFPGQDSTLCSPYRSSNASQMQKRDSNNVYFRTPIVQYFPHNGWTAFNGTKIIPQSENGRQAAKMLHSPTTRWRTTKPQQDYSLFANRPHVTHLISICNNSVFGGYYVGVNGD